MRLKYGSIRTYSQLCGREFASKAECVRAEELRLLEMAGEISDLKFQPRFVLSAKPRITYTADFQFYENGKLMVEDVKGVLTRETRVKLAWLKEQQGVEVKLS